MKKLLLATMLLGGVALAGNAKELTFIFDEEVVSNGSTVTWDKYEDYPYGGNKNEIWIEPPLFIKSDSDSKVNFRSTANYEVSFCIGTQCQNGKVVSISGVSLDPAFEEPLLLDVSIVYDKNEEPVIPAIEVLVEAWFEDEPTKVYSVNVKMGDVSAVHSVKADNNNITVNGKTLNYILEGAADVAVYSLSGKSVINKNVSGAGSISLANLPAGVYIYRVGGKNAKSGKFIIR